jgi:hypothetical protein
MAKKKVNLETPAETPVEAAAETVEEVVEEAVEATVAAVTPETALDVSAEAPEVTFIDSQVIQSVQGQVVQLDRCAVSGVAAEEDAYVERSLVVGGVAANGNAATSRSLVVGGVAAGNDAQASNGAMAAMVAGRDASLQAGYASVVVAGGDVEISQAGAEVMVVGGKVTAENTFIGMVIADQVELGEGSARAAEHAPGDCLWGGAGGGIWGSEFVDEAEEEVRATIHPTVVARAYERSPGPNSVQQAQSNLESGTMYLVLGGDEWIASSEPNYVRSSSQDNISLRAYLQRYRVVKAGLLRAAGLLRSRSRNDNGGKIHATERILCLHHDQYYEPRALYRCDWQLETTGFPA